MAQQPTEPAHAAKDTRMEAKIVTVKPNAENGVADSDVISITLDAKDSTFTIMHNGEIVSTEAAKALINAKLQKLADTIELRGDYRFKSIDIDTSGLISLSLKPRAYPRFGGSFRFLWGFHNWGNNMFNGLTGADGAYDLRTSFSSYQLELMANILFSKNWQLGVGVGYESDCYKFRHGYVAYDQMPDPMLQLGNSGMITAREGLTGNLADPNVWSTRLVARYINFPIRLGWNSGRGNIHIGFSVIPGFNYDSKHTGLKHRVEIDGYKYQNTDHNAENLLAAFKCDLRLDIRKGLFGIFVQIPTLPVNAPNASVAGGQLYPFKIGFFI